MPLCADPKIRSAIGVATGHAGMGFNIALMGLFGLVAAFNNHIGFGKASLHITMAKLGPGSHVRRFGGLGINPLGEDRVVQDWRIVGTGGINVDHMGQDLVIDLN